MAFKHRQASRRFADRRGAGASSAARAATSRRATAPGSTITGRPPSHARAELRRRLPRQVRRRPRARQGRRRRRDRAVAAGPPPTSTTGSGLMPGPEIQASAIATALEGFPLQDAPRLARHRCCSSLLGIAGAARRAAAAHRRSRSAIGVLALGGVPRRRPGRVQPRRDRLRVVYPVVAGIGGAPGHRPRIHGVTVAFEREQARDAFARFVPEAVVDQVLRRRRRRPPRRRAREATVMFSDLRGFTSFAETLEPERVIGVAEPLPDRDERGDPRPRRHARGLHGRRHHGRVRRAAAAGRPRRPRAGRRARHARPPGGLQRLAARARACTRASRWASASTAAR